MRDNPPEIKGTILLPFKPNLRINRSIINTTLDMYPDCSRMDMKPKRIAICGMNMTTPPIPGISASLISWFILLSGKTLLIQLAKLLKDASIKSMGIEDQEYIA